MCLRARPGSGSPEDNALVAWVRADHGLTVIEGIPCHPSYRPLTLSAACSHIVAVERSLDFPSTSGIMPLHRGDSGAAPFSTNPDPRRTKSNPSRPRPGSRIASPPSIGSSRSTSPGTTATALTITSAALPRRNLPPPATSLPDTPLRASLRWPRRSRCTAPQALIRGQPGVQPGVTAPE